MTNAVMNLDSVVSFYRDVPITNTMVPIYRNAGDQFNDWNRFRWGYFTNALYLDHSVGSMTVRVDADKNIYSTDWVSFSNPNFENQRFYARVTEIKQVTSGVVELSFTVNHFQTWMFQFRMRDCHIERQHMSQPQWDRAVANPFRNDIQELTTDEGVNINSSDEVQYEDPSTMWELTNRESVGKGVGTAIATPGGVSGLTTLIGGEAENAPFSGKDVPIGKNIMIALVSGSAEASFHVDLRKDNKTVYDAISPLSSALIYPQLMASVVVVGVGNKTKTTSNLTFGDKMYARAGLMKTLLEAVNNRNGLSVYGDIFGVWSVPEDVVLSAMSYGTVDSFLSDNYSPLKTIPVVDYNNISGYGNVRNPKLRRSPFRYVRVTSPTGNDKSLPIENFKGNEPKLLTSFYIAPFPTQSLSPVNYKGRSINRGERLDIQNFTTVPYKGNAWAEYLKEQQRTVLSQETKSARRARDIVNTGNADGSGGNFLGAIQKFGEVFQAGKNALSGLFSGDPAGAAEQTLDIGYERRAQREAENFMGNGYNDTDTYDGIYSHQRSAFVGQGEYYPGQSSGYEDASVTLHYTAHLVTLQPYIIHGLDAMLDNYGYRCDYYAIPRVYDYLHSANEDPHFATNYGKQFTYVKTKQANIYGVNATAANAIASVFDGGAKFLRGLQ